MHNLESQVACISSSSFTEYMQKKAFEFIDATEFKVLQYGKHRLSHDTLKSGKSMKSAYQVERQKSSFSSIGLKCVHCMKLQMKKRFKKQSKEDTLVVFLDLCVSCQAQLIIDTDIYDEAMNHFKSELKCIYQLMNMNDEQQQSMVSQDAGVLTVYDISGDGNCDSDDDGDLIAPSSSAETTINNNITLDQIIDDTVKNGWLYAQELIGSIVTRMMLVHQDLELSLLWIFFIL